MLHRAGQPRPQQLRHRWPLRGEKLRPPGVVVHDLHPLVGHTPNLPVRPAAGLARASVVPDPGLPVPGEARKRRDRSGWERER